LYEHLNRSNSVYDYYLADAYAGLGRAYTSAGDNRNALIHLNKALKLAKGAQLPNVLNSIGFLYMEQENYDQATLHYSRSLKLYQEDQNRWEAARVLLNLGVIEQRRGNIERALQLFRQSHSEAKSVNHQDVVIAALEGIGVILTKQEHFGSAIDSFREALKIAEKLGVTIGKRKRTDKFVRRYAHDHREIAMFGRIPGSLRKLACRISLDKAGKENRCNKC
jgi:tetratricopeptide (TPR) repeat protein